MEEFFVCLKIESRGNSQIEFPPPLPKKNWELNLTLYPFVLEGKK